MATGFIGRFWKFAFKCGVVVGLFFSVTIPVVWLMAPSWIENRFIEWMEQDGYKASLKVRLGASRSTVSDLRVEGKGLSLKVGEIWADYDFDSLSQTRVNNMVAREARLELDLDQLLSTEDEPEDTRSLEQQLHDWASLPFLYHTRLEKARLGVNSGGVRSQL
ncbi:MAG: hypothetical protein AAEJ57_01815, partial [Opitutales bacterium]